GPARAGDAPRAGEAGAPAGGAPSPAPGAPPGRAYGVVFGRVWLAALEAVRSMDRWAQLGADPARGEIRVEIPRLLRRAPRAARISVSLDDLGFTRVHATLLDENGAPLRRGEPRQIRRFYRRLEGILAGRPGR